MKKIILLLPLLILVLTGCGAKKSQDLSNSNKLPTPNQTKLADDTNMAEKKVIYNNEKFNFSLTLPERWRAYKVEETKDNSGYYYNFKLKNSKSINSGYGNPFVLAVLSKDGWKKIKSDNLNPWNYINEDNEHVFVYAGAQDDEGYIGFGEIIPGEEYHGPVYDVKNFIIPSFTFLEPKEEIRTETYMNKKFRYSFEYPTFETLNINGDRDQYLVNQASIMIVQAQSEDDKLNFENLMLKRVKLLCDADGTEGSITCPRYASAPESFLTNSGLPAYKLLFIEQTTKLQEAKEPVITSKNKIIYVVNLGGKGKDRLILAVVPVTEDLTMANNLVLSVKKY